MSAFQSDSAGGRSGDQRFSPVYRVRIFRTFYPPSGGCGRRHPCFENGRGFLVRSCAYPTALNRTPLGPIFIGTVHAPAQCRRHCRMSDQCPLYPRKRTSLSAIGMPQNVRCCSGFIERRPDLQVTLLSRPIQKVSPWRGEIAPFASGNRRNSQQRFPGVGINGGTAAMTISEYLAATALVALILWAVLGLLMQES
jgi:hypothetical protein